MLIALKLTTLPLRRVRRAVSAPLGAFIGGCLSVFRTIGTNTALHARVLLVPVLGTHDNHDHPRARTKCT